MDSSLPPLKKLKYNSWHRGTKENDLLLGPFADAHLEAMPLDELEIYASFLDEIDVEIYSWIMGNSPAPAKYQQLVNTIRKFHD